MSFDLNDAELQKAGDLIPDGTFAKVVMLIRHGGVDGYGDVDRGLLRRSATPGSDVLMLDCEFTITEGQYSRRKFWQTLTTSGGKLDENGVSIGGKITKSTLRAMLDSAHGLDPEDMSDAAKAKRVLGGYADFAGITFVAKIKVEASNSPDYPDRNKLDRPVLPTEPEWQQVMNGETVSARPSNRPRKQGSSSAASPAWAAPHTTSKTPPSGGAPKTPESAPRGGPAWLKR